MEQLISFLIGISLNFRICIPPAIACIMIIHGNLINLLIISIAYGISSLLIYDKYSWVSDATKFITKCDFSKYSDFFDYIIDKYELPSQFNRSKDYLEYTIDNKERIDRLMKTMNISHKEAVLYSRLNCNLKNYPSYEELESAEILISKEEILQKVIEQQELDVNRVACFILIDRLEERIGKSSLIDSLNEKIRGESIYSVYFEDLDEELFYAKNDGKLLEVIESMFSPEDEVCRVTRNKENKYIHFSETPKWITKYEYFLRLNKNRIMATIYREIPDGGSLYPSLIEVLLEGDEMYELEEVEKEIMNILKGEECQKYEAIEVDTGNSLGEFVCINWKSAEELAKESLQLKNPTSKSQIILKKGDQEKII